jgi:hypothetical protein
LESDLADLMADPELIDKGMVEAEGKVSSVRFAGLKPGLARTA